MQQRARRLGWVVAMGLVTLTGSPGAGVACVIDADCDDGVFCNGIESCFEGNCVGISSCPPFVDGCLTVTCDEDTDTCPIVPNDALCDDGVFCNGAEHCDPDTKACVAIDACPAFIDGCVTFGSCDEDTDSCPGVPDDAACDDGFFCNGAESCDLDTRGCVAISACPPFQDGCLTAKGCDEDTDTCLVGPDDTLCPDGQICQADGSCVAGTTTTTSTVTTTSTSVTTTTVTTSSTSTSVTTTSTTFTTVTTSTSVPTTSTTSTTVATTTSSTATSTSTTSTTATSSTLLATSTTVPTTTTTTAAGSTTSTTVPADDHPLSGAKLLLKDNATNSAKRRLKVLSRDAAQLGLADVPDVTELLAAGGSLRVTAVGGDGFDTTYPLLTDGWGLLKTKTPAKGVRFKDKAGPITKVTLKAGKQLQLLGKGASLQHSIALEPDLVRIELRVGTRRYCLEFGGTENAFTASKSLRRKDAGRPVDCP